VGGAIAKIPIDIANQLNSQYSAVFSRKQQAKFTSWVLLLRMQMRRSRTDAVSPSLDERSKVNAPEGGGSLTRFSVTNLKH
jgi:hypothetical protein